MESHSDIQDNDIPILPTAVEFKIATGSNAGQRFSIDRNLCFLGPGRNT